MAHLIVSGIVEGVEFTKSGVFTNEKSGEKINFDSSVTLQLSTVVDVFKMGIATKSKKSFKVKIPTTDEKLEFDVQKYNQFIGKSIETNFVPTDGQKFNVLGEVRLSK